MSFLFKKFLCNLYNSRTASSIELKFDTLVEQLLPDRLCKFNIYHFNEFNNIEIFINNFLSYKSEIHKS